ncbi:MAG: lytic polysaccharide monooxygenase [Gammaproteobacteria bacterium]|nr:lytic polysaccharide monooxygenase [Gammaproteobacteria bacterium]
MPGRNKIITAMEIIILIIIAMLYTELARAHARFVLDSATPPRSYSDGIKTGPCGNIPRTQNPATFDAGQQITVEWEETINHPGYFRVAFSPEGDLGFDDNVLYQADDNQDDLNVPHFYSAAVTLPNEACENCTLQLIQYMTDRNPPTLYYSCADIRLVANTPPQDVQNLVAASGINEVSIVWQYPAAGELEVLILQSTSAIAGAPVSGQAYQAGDPIDSANVVYVGNASQYVETGLAAGQTYHYKVFVFDADYRYSPGIEVQQTVAPAVDDTLPPLPVQNFTATVINNTVELSWQNPVEDFYKVLVIWDTNPIVTDPIANTRYDQGDDIGTARVLFNGLGSTAIITDLTAGLTYHFKIFAHDASFNYASGVGASVFLPAGGVNQAPQLSLAISQNGSPVARIYQDRGPVTMTVLINDDSDVSQATISWGGTDSRLVDTDTLSNTLTFDPSMLPLGTYTVHIAVADNGNPPQTGTLSINVEVAGGYSDDTAGAGSVGHVGLLLFLLLLQRFYASRTRRL